jgi:hypothetical protein
VTPIKTTEQSHRNDKFHFRVKLNGATEIEKNPPPAWGDITEARGELLRNGN